MRQCPQILDLVWGLPELDVSDVEVHLNDWISNHAHLTWEINLSIDIDEFLHLKLNINTYNSFVSMIQDFIDLLLSHLAFYDSANTVNLVARMLHYNIQMG